MVFHAKCIFIFALGRYINVLLKIGACMWTMVFTWNFMALYSFRCFKIVKPNSRDNFEHYVLWIKTARLQKRTEILLKMVEICILSKMCEASKKIQFNFRQAHFLVNRLHYFRSFLFTHETIYWFQCVALYCEWFFFSLRRCSFSIAWGASLSFV